MKLYNFSTSKLWVPFHMPCHHERNAEFTRYNNNNILERKVASIGDGIRWMDGWIRDEEEFEIRFNVSNFPVNQKELLSLNLNCFQRNIVGGKGTSWPFSKRIKREMQQQLINRGDNCGTRDSTICCPKWGNYSHSHFNCYTDGDSPVFICIFL